MRTKAILLVAMVAALSACHHETAAEKAARDARDVAAVKRVNASLPPVKAVAPEDILFPDITEHKLYGSGCNFVANGGGMAAQALALDKQAYIKLEGAIVTLAADEGSTKMPKGSWSHYDGKQYQLTLAKIGDAPNKVNGLVEMFPAHMEILDETGRAAYSADGTAQCKPM